MAGAARGGGAGPLPSLPSQRTDDRLEDKLAVAVVVHAVLEREVDRVVAALARAEVEVVAGAGKVLAVLVEGRRHHAVGRVEGLLHAVAVVDVNVDVEHARVHLEQLQDAQHAVVDVAEAARLALLGVVQPAAPVDDNVRLARVQPRRAADRAARAQLAELKEAVVDGAVLRRRAARGSMSCASSPLWAARSCRRPQRGRGWSSQIWW